MSGRHSLNAPGEWYVDRRCTDCSAARTVAPGLIVDKDGQSVFARQPKTKSEVMMAWRARLLCPTASVRMETPSDTPADVFPEKMTEDVYRLAWDFDDEDLVAFKDYCWHSWPEHLKSLRRLLEFPFEWVFAGHGGSMGLPRAEMHARLAALIVRSRKNNPA
jgi:hypothetical protein